MSFGLAVVAVSASALEFRPTTLSNVIVRSAERAGGSSIRAVSSLPEIVGTRAV
jgi:hypothetical protein